MGNVVQDISDTVSRVFTPPKRELAKVAPGENTPPARADVTADAKSTLDRARRRRRQPSVPASEGTGGSGVARVKTLLGN